MFHSQAYVSFAHSSPASVFSESKGSSSTGTFRLVLSFRQHRVSFHLKSRGAVCASDGSEGVGYFNLELEKLLRVPFRAWCDQQNHEAPFFPGPSFSKLS